MKISPDPVVSGEAATFKILGSTGESPFDDLPASLFSALLDI